MKFYLISEQRLKYELEHNAKGKGKGVINWTYIPNEYGVTIFTLFYDIYDVTYIYRSDKMPMWLKVMNGISLSRIDKILDYEDIYPEEEDMISLPTVEELGVEE